MDLRVMAATFGAIFIAELADKTQLVGIGMASKTLKPISVFLGSVAAYAVITAISVFLGTVLGERINPVYMRYAGAVVFISLGILMFLDRI